MAKDNFIFHHNYINREEFSAEECGLLIFAMIDYSETDKEPKFDDRAMRTEWKRIRERMDVDREAYEERCEINRENAKKGGAPKGNQNAKKNNRTVEKTTETTERLKKQPKQPDIDIDIDSDIDLLKKTKAEKKPEVYSSDPELDKTIREFIEHRKQIKKPMKELALKKMLNKLDSLADNVPDKIEILNESIANGWQGIFPLDKRKPRQTGTDFQELMRKAVEDDEQASRGIARDNIGLLSDIQGGRIDRQGMA